jgi:hypothetical protein
VLAQCHCAISKAIGGALGKTFKYLSFPVGGGTQCALDHVGISSPPKNSQRFQRLQSGVGDVVIDDFSRVMIESVRINDIF